MNEIQESVAARLGSNTKMVSTSSPGYSSTPPTLQCVYAVLVLIAEVGGHVDRRIPDSDPLDTGKPGSIPPLDEICGFSGPE